MLFVEGRAQGDGFGGESANTAKDIVSAENVALLGPIALARLSVIFLSLIIVSLGVWVVACIVDR